MHESRDKGDDYGYVGSLDGKHPFTLEVLRHGARLVYTSTPFECFGEGITASKLTTLYSHTVTNHIVNDA